VHEIEELKRQGLSVRAISRLTGHCRKTISKYLKGLNGIPEYGPRPPVAGKLAPFQDYLNERLSAGVWNARVLLRELQERGYSGSYTLLTDWL
jgi:transposase